MQSEYKLKSTIIPAKEEKKNAWILIHGMLGEGLQYLKYAETKEMSLNSEIHLIDLRNHG